MTDDATGLPPAYDPAGLEGPIYARWEAAGAFTPPSVPRGTPYCIVIPPPNVTGSLHVGHALGHTLMDALTRRRRMLGDDVLWLPGTDHAGISTQTVVERELAREGLSRHVLGREAFIDRVWEWKAEYGNRILNQMRRLGDGVDWSRERFTLDEGLSRAVRTVFVRMYRDGLIYRAERIINWCPRCLTALSDIEVESSEDDGELVTLRYGPLEVATTRVETMLGDTAVAVHPEDPRYAHLVGTEVELPLTGRRIPVVADPHVDPSFGTGAVKVTPAHDPNDFEIGQRHGLPALTIMDERAVITAPGPFEGLDRYEARPAITAALRGLGLVTAERRPYRHAVPHCERCQTVVEPRLSLQWFVRVADLAAAAGDMVRSGQVTFSPVELAPRFFAWVDDMHDWCISRQLWWGHRIPVFTCPDGHVTVSESDPSRCEECGRDGLEQDPDVLDTWFSSGLWPFSTLGWPEQTADLERFFPTDVLVTGYDIIFFWVARMMMFSAYAMGGPPFRTVALHGLVRDGHGKKMSKSWGNAIDPLEWMDRYGADAVRFTLARGANPGADVAVSEDWVRGSRNFINKIWNATRFALLRGADPHAGLPDAAQLSTADRWVLSRLGLVCAEVNRHFDELGFAKACEALYHFAWDEVFDWYLEAAKVSLEGGGDAAASARAVLGHVLDTLLRLLHPVIPFVTEELWTRLTGGESLVSAAWPGADSTHLDPAAEAAFERLRSVVAEVRAFRSQQKIDPRTRLSAALLAGATADVAALEAPESAGELSAADASTVAALAGLTLIEAAACPAAARRLPVAGLTVLLDTGLDPAAERERLLRQRSAAAAEQTRLAGKLASPTFVDRAPPDVVAQTRARLTTAAAQVAELTDRLADL